MKVGQNNALLLSVPNITGRPGCQTMDMNEGSSASYLARAPCVPLFVLCLIRVETEGLFDYQGRTGMELSPGGPVIFGVDIGPPDSRHL